MVDFVFTMPESRPEDDEDVVWGLSTASALWARGERGDAIVWLRRAADAATAAGQEGRAAELGMVALRAEQALEQITRRTHPPAAEPDRPSLGVEVEIETVSPAPAPPPAQPPAPAAQPHVGPSAIEDGSAHQPVVSPAPKPQALPRPGTLHPPPAQVAPRPLSVAPPAIFPAQSVPAPPAAPARPAAPHTAAAPAPSAQSTPPPAPSPATVPAPASSYPGTRRTSGPRAPILDPWGEEPTLPNIRVEPAKRGVQLEGDEVVVHMRPSPPRATEDDDGVITSAAPLDQTMRRLAHPPAPPARRMTATGEQPPGHIADASAAVTPKLPASKPHPPAPPPAASAAGAAPPAPAKPPSVGAAQEAGAHPKPPTPMEPGASRAHEGTTAPRPPAPSKPSTPAATPGIATVTSHDVQTQPTQPSPIPRPRSITVPPPPSAEGAAAGAVRLAAPRVPTVGRPTVQNAAPAHPPAPATAPAQPPRASVRPPAPRPGSVSVRPPTTAPPTPVEAGSALRSPSPPVTARSPQLDASVLDAVEAFADVPPEARERLASLARVEALGADEEVSGFGAALLVEGVASVCATIVDEPVSRAAVGTLIPVRGTLSEAVALRVVAGDGGARVALWDQAPIDQALRACPWVLEELVARADQLQARAAATMGPLGDLDEPTRDRVLDRLAVQVARAHEAIALGPFRDVGSSAAAKDTDFGAALVCAGSIEVSAGGKASVLRAGEALLPQKDAHAKAGAQGAILLVADASTAADLATGPLASLLTPR